MVEWEELERSEVVTRRVTVTYRAPAGVAPVLKHDTKTVYFQPARLRVQFEFGPQGATIQVVVSGLDERGESAMAFFDADDLDAAPEKLAWLREGAKSLFIQEF